MRDFKAMPMDAPLAVTTRGGLAENEFRGRLCVVSADGEHVLESRGDTAGPAFIRSTGKPMQAIEPLLGGVAEAFGWEDRHLAMLGASQRGYAEQVEAIAEMLRSADVPEEAFAFKAVAPTAARPKEDWVRAGAVPRKIYHTCAGKHLGMLAWCKRMGWPLEGYAEPDHPAQRRIVARVREWMGAGEAETAVGRDGCGLPVTAVPMWRTALAYARLACPDTAPDAAAARAAERVVRAMNRYPDLVEGPGRLASLLLADPNIVAKSGAQGLFTLGLRKERLGIAVHLSDGSEAAWGPVVIAMLEKYGGASPETMERLRARYPRVFRNDAGAEAGTWEVVF